MQDVKILPIGYGEFEEIKKVPKKTLKKLSLDPNLSLLKLI